MQRDMVGMEMVNVEQMYQPSRKKMSGKKKVKKTKITTPRAQKRIIKMTENISVNELSKQLGIKSRKIIKSLMAEGMMANENEMLDSDMAGIIASNYDYEISQEIFDEKSHFG